MIQSSDIELCLYDEVFLELSYHWLQDEELNYLQDVGNISKEGQIKWFESLKFRNDYFVWGVKFLNKPIGVCGIKNVNQHEGEYFGYIGEKSLWGRGLGKLMMLNIEMKARALGIHTIVLHVLKDNFRAISLYKKMGFKDIDCDFRYIKMLKKLDL